ncbi:hypothetical protein [Acinetobacter stercoris]|uniref:Lipoprotein n=1 Tax=Acinetobacter stercoris TaxID=2126983 RepID=A0A2U3N2F9_9GAMM|nr:hypothetical protein [Acinetobacter stercoris]SPL71858.1 hypothetical protein KPC_3036 [Acinetobacter stercoris]
MRYMILLKIILGGIFLTGCTTTKYISQPINEKIYSIAYQVEQDNLGKVYAIGEKFDYVISPCDKSITYTKESSERCRNGLAFIVKNRQYIRGVVLDFELKKTDSKINVTQGYYKAFLPTNSIGKKEFQDKNSFLYKEITKDEENQFSISNDDFIKVIIPFQGEVVKLSNREQILKLGQFKEPLIVQTSMSEVKKSRSLMPIAKGIGAVIIAPVGLVLMIPGVAIIGYCESHHC